MEILENITCIPRPAGKKRGGPIKIVKCGDLGFRCNFIAAGNDAEKLKKEMLEHIENYHQDVFADMSEDDINHIKYRISTLLSRGCGCGAL